MNKNKEFDLEIIEKELKNLGVDLEKADFCLKNKSFKEVLDLAKQFVKKAEKAIENQEAEATKYRAEYLKCKQEFEQNQTKLKNLIKKTEQENKNLSKCDNCGKTFADLYDKCKISVNYQANNTDLKEKGWHCQDCAKKLVKKHYLEKKRKTEQKKFQGFYTIKRTFITKDKNGEISKISTKIEYQKKWYSKLLAFPFFILFLAFFILVFALLAIFLSLFFLIAAPLLFIGAILALLGNSKTAIVEKTEKDK